MGTAGGKGRGGKEEGRGEEWLGIILLVFSVEEKLSRSFSDQ